MRYTITKFKMESGKFDITYTKYVQGMDEQHSLKSYEKPRPEFKEAHVAMKALLLSKFGAFKFAQNMVAVSGIEFRYGGKDFFPDEVSGIKVKGYLRNKESEVCVFSTKWLDVDKELAEDINLVLGEIEAYIEGKRAQANLFDEEQQANGNANTSDEEIIGEDDDLDMDDADDIAPYENSPFNRAARGLN